MIGLEVNVGWRFVFIKKLADRGKANISGVTSQKNGEDVILIVFFKTSN